MNKLFITIIALSSITLQAGYFSRSLVGSMTGSMIGNALTQPRTIIVRDNDDDEVRPSKHTRRKLKKAQEENESLRADNDALQKKQADLVERLEKLEKKIK